MKLKLNNINLIHTITAIVMVFGLSGCAKELDELGGMKPSEVISFTTTLPSQSTKANATELSGRGMSLYTSGNLAAEEVNLSGNSLPAATTKGEPATQLAGTAGIIGYLRGNDDVRLWSALNNKEFKFDGDELKNTGANVSWKAAESETDATHLRIYAIAPKTAIPNETSATDALKLALPDNEKNLTDAPTLTYTVPADIDKQQDLLVAFTEVATNFRMSIPLQFNHILTGIRFKAGFECTIKSVELKNIVFTGTYSMDGQWNLGSTVADFSTDNTNDTFFLLPQAFDGTYTEDNEPAVVITYTEDGSTENKTIKAGLKDLEWEAGKLITYTIYKENAKPSYIFFDLAAGEVNITAEKYSGKVYKDGTAEDVTGEYSNNHIYYVYQSSESDTKYNKENTGYKTGSSECRIPDYDAVMYENRPWRDWIINNKDVVKVIEVWDDSKNLGVTQMENYTEGYLNTAVVRDVGRTHTQNRILVTGGNVTVEGAFNCKLIIDDIYINYYDGSNGYRKDGAITFKPTDNTSQLTIHTKGDNRLGNIHYCNFNEANTPSLIFEGEGSLTVADTDFKTGKYSNNDNFPYGYYSNHHESAIGGSDDEENDKAYGIVFKSGIIYAGTTLAENCTAIGGGGNEVGGITIEGGVVTAVTSTTGTAIGGGIGFSSEGGIGNVVIRGGYVYAYNLGNPVNIPSAAIGGAGSSNSFGSEGKVEISGGYVYAESVLGTAIGGGSSKTQKGGSANVIISGGTIIAKSIGKGTLKAGAGIGGGTGCSGGNGKAENLDGGDATIRISGNPVIRTGSVGGGATGDRNSKIGSATIEISGTPDIQAQFVMAKGAGTAPSFTMSGGTIRNSHTTDHEYIHIQDKGGAVYMEEGTLTMTGGTITNCSAVEGGAIYITGGSASIGDNAIINGNLASAGNGGGVCIYNGNFEMSGNAEISNNSSQFRTLPGNSNGTGGNGGGIYVSSSDNATVSILQGTIKGNTADRNGGGIAVDMSANNDKTARITIGEAGAGDTDPDISGNTSLILGGGLYASGAKADITINSGKIMDNSTSGYTYNVNVANEGGTVTLNGGNVTHQTVTFNANGGNINGAATAQQKIVTSTNSLLKAPDPTRTGYNFNGWNTRQDGNGTPYADGATMNLSADLTLYAQWQIIQ